VAQTAAKVRGNDRTTTTGIPGFQGVALVPTVKHAVKDFFDDDMMTYAAALSFRILLALFPFIIFLLALLGAFGLTDFFDRVLDEARVALPGEAYVILDQVIGEVRSGAQGGLISVSILFAIWAASTAVRSLMNALNTAYDIEESRPAWQLYPLSIAYTIGLAAFVAVAAVLALVGPQAIEWFSAQLGLAEFVASLWTWLRWPAAVLLILLAVALTYYVAPNVKQPFQVVTPGSVVAVLGWIVASVGFTIYVSNFANYTATYGSLGGVIVLLLFFFISSAVFLLGAELNAAIYHARHGAATPKAPPKPSR
jgi:membrane protein